MKIRVIEEICLFDKIYGRGELIEVEKETGLNLIRNNKAELILRELTKSVVKNWEVRNGRNSSYASSE